MKILLKYVQDHLRVCICFDVHIFCQHFLFEVWRVGGAMYLAFHVGSQGDIRSGGNGSPIIKNVLSFLMLSKLLYTPCHTGTFVVLFCNFKFLNPQFELKSAKTIPANPDTPSLCFF